VRVRVVTDLMARIAGCPGQFGSAQYILAALEECRTNAVSGKDVEDPGGGRLGPSSKVSASALRPGLPRQTEGPNTAEERPRTAQEIPAAVAPSEDASNTGAPMRIQASSSFTESH